MKYCDDCPSFDGSNCKLGHEIVFKTPKSYKDILTTNWGWHKKVKRAYQVTAKHKDTDVLEDLEAFLRSISHE